MHFRFSPQVLSRLGEELIPNPEQGIIELVKNAYDADATECIVELGDPRDGRDGLIISDDGRGMDTEAIGEGFLVIGSSKKTVREPTPKYGRLPVGDKGLGRLAALRQGSKVSLTTSPEEEPGVEYSLKIDWDEVAKAQAVEDVDFEIHKANTDFGPGTRIEVQHLNARLGRRQLQTLARELVLLADPFDDDIGFHPKLVAPAFADLEKKVKDAYFDDAEYRLHARLDDEGRAEVWLSDWRGRVVNHAMGDEVSFLPYQTVAAEFELWAFKLSKDSKAFSARNTAVQEVRKWLNLVGGVHLYHRGLRVRPYGDPGHDWLDMNLARTRSPEERPSTNNSIGRVTVDDPGGALIQKTDRAGFIENQSFFELKRFCVDVLDWMAKFRLREAEKRREQDRQDATPRSNAAAKKEVEKVIDALPREARPIVSKAVRQYESARDRESKALRNDLQLYRSLATAGAVSARLAHESGKPMSRIGRLATVIEQTGRRLLDGQYSGTLEKPVDLLRRSVETIQNYSALSLRLLTQNKRRSGTVEMHGAVDEVLELFEPFLEEAEIRPVVEKVDANPRVSGSAALLEAVLANLLINSINALTKVRDAPTEDRRVLVRTELSEDRVLLRVMDNGLGIKDIALDEIWLPGRTTIEDGTGFGLTIVKDSVADMEGSVTALPNGELGGAEFVVDLPLAPPART